MFGHTVQENEQLLTVSTLMAEYHKITERQTDEHKAALEDTQVDE